MRGILYGLFGVSEEDKDKWMTKKSWRGILIDLILMYSGGIILGVIIIKILLRFRVGVDIKMVKYAMIIILNLVVFGIYYGMHRELVDDYTEEIFDSIFEADVGKKPEVPIFSEGFCTGHCRNADGTISGDGGGLSGNTGKKGGGGFKGQSWWNGATLYMGEKAVAKF